MILLDSVEFWTESAIVCLTSSHRLASNPLRHNSRLSSLSGVEYGAQAMAVHGALISDGKARPGLLAALRNVICNVAYLDDIRDDLTVSARRLTGKGDGSIYAFSVRSADADLVSGEAVVVFR